MFYTVFSAENKVAVVAEIIPYNGEFDMHRNVINKQYATYELSKFVVRRMYDLFTKQNYQHSGALLRLVEYKREMYDEDCGDYYSAESGCQYVSFCIFLNTKPVHELTYRDFCEIETRAFELVKMNKYWKDMYYEFSLKPFKCFQSLEGAINQYNREHYIEPFTYYTKDGKKDHVDCCCLTIPTKCCVIH